MYIYIYSYVYSYTFSYIYSYIYVHIYITCVHIYIHTYIRAAVREALEAFVAQEFQEYAWGPCELPLFKEERDAVVRVPKPYVYIVR